MESNPMYCCINGVFCELRQVCDEYHLNKKLRPCTHDNVFGQNAHRFLVVLYFRSHKNDKN